MAVFKTKKASLASKPQYNEADKSLTAAKTTGGSSRAGILTRPRITEKSSNMASNSAYVFDVAERSNKILVSEVIYELYKVRPTKVRVVQVPSKRRFVRGRPGVKSGGKKCYVFLKKGEKMDL